MPNKTASTAKPVAHAVSSAFQPGMEWVVSTTVGGSPIRAAIINATGYVGAELARLLAQHPRVEIACVTGRSEVGKRLPEVFPHLWSLDLPIVAEVEPEVDVVFSGLPHAAAAERLTPLIERGIPVIDASADFRLYDEATYERWYGEHPSPHLLPESVYGLPELHREAIAESRLVGVPGCYPTSAILALAPLAAKGWLDGRTVVDAKSGVSGAGRALKLTSHFSEVDSNFSAYGLGGHRHQPEMVQELSTLQRSAADSLDGGFAGGAGELALTFVPHLVPMTRGILATCYPSVAAGVLPERQDERREALREVYESFYADEPFVHVAPSAPSTKQTLGSNACIVHPWVDPVTSEIAVISALDNLVKGTAGAAVQCFNLMFGLPEELGLSKIGVYP